MAYYPAFLDLDGRLVLVVGGGQVAARKVASLLQAGARVRLVAPRLCPDCAGLAAGDQVELCQRAFDPQDLEGAWLAICATDDQALNRQVADQAQRQGVFVNVVDVPELCSFIVPASLRRGDLCLAVSTGGASPALARRLREGLEQQFGPEWAGYLNLLRALRQRLISQGRPSEQNRESLFALVDSELFDLLAAGDLAGVEQLLQRLLGPGFSLAELGLSAEQVVTPGEGER